jgi:lipid A oxidase
LHRGFPPRDDGWMRSSTFVCLTAILSISIVAGFSRPAHAQWYAAQYLGENHTTPSDVSIDQPGRGTAIVFHDVSFDARPFSFPLYYGARIGKWFGHSNWGLEFEFLHLKVISRTDLPVRVSGTVEGAPLDQVMPMNVLVSRYDMTHGLNFLLLNIVHRTPIGDPARAHPLKLVLRGGLGPTRPGVSNAVQGVVTNGYEYAGFGGGAGAALVYTCYKRLSVMAEYKFTFTRPRVTVDGGHGQMTAKTHQILGGLTLDLTRR